jgi:hypothetical protein
MSISIDSGCGFTAVAFQTTIPDRTHLHFEQCRRTPRVFDGKKPFELLTKPFPKPKIDRLAEYGVESALAQEVLLEDRA